MPRLYQIPPRVELLRPLYLEPLKLIEPRAEQVLPGIEFESQQPGRWAARKDIDKATFHWQRGMVDRARRGLESIRDGLLSHAAGSVPPVRDGVLYSYQGTTGGIVHKIGGKDASWLSITEELKPPGGETVFRLRTPNARTGESKFYVAGLSPLPKLPSVGIRQPQWIDVVPATADLSAQVHPATPPGTGSHAILVTTPAGGVTLVGQVGDHLMVRADDPILGLNSPVEGAAFLRDYPRVEEAMHAAAEAKDGLRRGVRLGKDVEDGVALVGAHGVMLVPPGHLWTNRLLQAIITDPLHRPLIRFEGDGVIHVDRSDLTVSPAYGRRQMTLDEVMNTTRGDVYLHEKYRSMLVFENGAFIPHSLPRNTRVIVREAVAANRLSVEGRYSQPDVRMHGGAEWFRIGAIASGSTVSASNGQILLVCPDTADQLSSCEE